MSAGKQFLGGGGGGGGGRAFGPPNFQVEITLLGCEHTSTVVGIHSYS